MEQELNWDHLRIFLEVIRSSSFREAAERMGVSHPTIRRKLETLEEQLGLRLFHRRSDGLHATTEATKLLEKAEQIEAAVHALSRCASNSKSELTGKIHITAPDMLLSDLLAPDIADFAREWPQIELDIGTTYEIANLGSREADVAIRVMPLGQSPDEELAGRKAATMSVALYGSGDRFIGWDSERREREMFPHYQIPDVPYAGVIKNVYLLRALCLEGVGLAMLPCFMADPYLEQHSEPILSGDIWVLVHPDLRKNPRLRLFRDEIVAALKRRQSQLSGEKK